MFNPFKPRSILSDDEIEWLFDVYQWLLSNTGGMTVFRETTLLVLPTPTFFPVAEVGDEDRAGFMFEMVKEFAGMSEWDCTLVKHDQPAETHELIPDFPTGASAATEGAAGTFTVQESGSSESVEISYAEGLESDPLGFVATMAHELAHYLQRGFEKEPPGGEENVEFATDVTSVFLGFGVFACITVFRFKQTQTANTQGYQFQTQGYLSAEMLSYALAIFLHLHGDSEPDARAALSPTPRAYLKKAMRDIDARWSAQLATLQQ